MRLVSSEGAFLVVDDGEAVRRQVEAWAGELADALERAAKAAAKVEAPKPINPEDEGDGA